MKEIKSILWALYVAIYTSLWWGVFVFHGLKTPDGFPVGYLVLALWTIANIMFCSAYIIDHWDDDKNEK
jgi:hypothetical protein